MQKFVEIRYGHLFRTREVYEESFFSQHRSSHIVAMTQTINQPSFDTLVDRLLVYKEQHSIV